MKALQMIAGLVLSATLATPVAFAQGFEAYGYRQGMTKNEVEALATSRNRKIEIEDHWWSVFSDPSKPLTMYFCDNKLYRVSWLFEGGFMAFLRVTEDFIRDQGYEHLDAVVRVSVSYDGKDFGQLAHYLRRNGEAYYVAVVLFGSDEWDTLNGQITYEEEGEHKNCD